MSAAGLVIVSNALDPPPDEGIRRCAQQLTRILSARGAAVVGVPAGAPLAARKLLLSPGLWRRLRRARPRAVVYIPSQPPTLGTFARAAVLRAVAGAPVTVLCFQPRRLGLGQRFLARRLGPRPIVTPSPTLLATAQAASIPSTFLPLGVDLESFVPVTEPHRRELRSTHGLPQDATIVLHVGHARRGRGLGWMADLAQTPGIAPVVVISSFGEDADVIAQLRDAGVRVVDRFMPEMHELYQLTDVYAFPVRDEHAAIGVPLSVLEAMACDRPVVTTPFGGLARMFAATAGLGYVEEFEDFRAAVLAASRLDPARVGTRAQVNGYSWDALADALVLAVSG